MLNIKKKKIGIWRKRRKQEKKRVGENEEKKSKQFQEFFKKFVSLDDITNI